MDGGVKEQPSTHHLGERRVEHEVARSTEASKQASHRYHCYSPSSVVRTRTFSASFWSASFPMYDPHLLPINHFLLLTIHASSTSSKARAASQQVPVQPQPSAVT